MVEVMVRSRLWFIALSVCWLGTADSLWSQGQATQLDGELQRLQGNWRVVEMVENGHTIPEDQMRTFLPGGGLLEIVDGTMLFKSPVDGHKSTKSFRIDASSYPKKIAIFDLERMTGQGIYQHDGGRLVICVSHPPAGVPVDFSAPAGSSRTMMVLVPYNESEAETLKIALGPPPSVERTADTYSAFPAVPNAVPARTSPPTPVPVPNQSAAGRILTDNEVKSMMLGNWRMNDGAGLIDVTFDARGVFRSYRHAQEIQTFHQVFVATPVSSGTWTVQGGQLFLDVTSSWRADLVNHRVVYAVRSISSSDAIIVDTLGRVAKVDRIP